LLFLFQQSKLKTRYKTWDTHILSFRGHVLILRGHSILGPEGTWVLYIL